MPYGAPYQSKWGVRPSRPLRARGGQITHERMLIGLKQRHMTTVTGLLKAKREKEERFAPGRIAVQRSTTGWNNTLAERRNLSDKSTEHFESEQFWKLSSGKKEISTIGAASQRCRQEKLKTLKEIFAIMWYGLHGLRWGGRAKACG